MNNEAFQALVRERRSLNEKSSKEIAREAVEEEFKLRKRKRRGGDSSDEEDDHDGVNDNDRRQRRLEEDETRLMQPTTKMSQSKDAHATNKYRDRAKERREGKIQPLLDSDTNTNEVVEHEVDNDDEDNHHHIKGLDIAQLRKEKQVLEKSTTVRTAAPTTSNDVTQTLPVLELVQDAQQAKQLLERTTPMTFTSELAKDMHDVLRNVFLKQPALASRHFSTSAAGVSIQRSSFTFSLRSHPHDNRRAWETPLEITHAAATSATSMSNQRESTSRLGHDLIDRITKALTPVTAAVSHHHHNAHPSVAATAVLSSSSFDAALETKSKSHEEPNDASSDEDIFDDDTHEPRQESSEPSSQVTSLRISKGSIFTGLAAASEITETTQSNTTPSGLLHRIAQQLQDGGATSLDAITTKTSGDGGVSMSAYGGYYGEEMDVDFDGRFADDDQDDNKDDTKKKKKNKSWAEDTTLASQEYGAGRSRGKKAPK